MVKDNLSIYKAVKAVPPEAQKAIGGGRLKGMTDINPMWRIKTLTEQFGVCGFGWKYEITEKKLEHGSNDQIAAFVDIDLYIKMGDEWSAAIPGTGGSSFVAKESSGLYTSDECFKMALTDAISVACKSLGFGAEVYWSKDRTKYNQQEEQDEFKHVENLKPSKVQILALNELAKNKGIDLQRKSEEITGKTASKDWTMQDYCNIKNEIDDMKDKVS
jgi:hypothetical protein